MAVRVVFKSAVFFDARTRSGVTQGESLVDLSKGLDATRVEVLEYPYEVSSFDDILCVRPFLCLG